MLVTAQSWPHGDREPYKHYSRRGDIATSQPPGDIATRNIKNLGISLPCDLSDLTSSANTGTIEIEGGERRRERERARKKEGARERKRGKRTRESERTRETKRKREREGERKRKNGRRRSEKKKKKRGTKEREGGRTIERESMLPSPSLVCCFEDMCFNLTSLVIILQAQ